MKKLKLRKCMLLLLALVMAITIIPMFSLGAHARDLDSCVVRVFGATRYDTAFDTADYIKDLRGIDKFNCVVVASGEDFADALSGSYLANAKDAPMLLVRNRNKEISLVKDYINANLKPGGTVYLLGGEKAVPKAMELGLPGFSVKRLSGATRYDTNLAVLAEAGVGNKEILVCTGKDFADGLSASAVNKPVLLVKDSLTAAQKQFLGGLSGNKFYVIGGTNAVNTKIENALKTYGSVSRLSGATRYQTSVEIAKTFFPNADSAVVVYGLNFPDGLSGGCLAYTLKAPLILSADGKQSIAKTYTSPNGIYSGAVLGGSGLISDKTVRDIFAMPSGSQILHYPEITPVCAHINLTATAAKAPACTEAGNIAYWYCRDCGKYFKNAEATSEVALADTVVGAMGHIAGAEATCTKDQTCTVCGTVLADATGHTAVINKAVKPTCTENGLTEGSHCSVCNVVIVDQNKVEKTGHTAGAKVTCTEDQSCTVCGTVLAEATGHTEVIDQAVDPTYSTTGLTEGRHCSVCNKVIVAQETIPVLPVIYHTITYRNLQGAESPVITKFAEHIGIALEDVPEPVRVGYNFLGWYTASEGGTKVDEIAVGTAKDVILYAHWDPIQYKITYKDAPRNSNPIEYTIEQEVVLSDAEWNGLTFKNWTTENGQPISKIEKGSTGNITLYANWIYEENMAVPSKESGIKTVVYDEEKNRYYFVYDLGVIDNVVLETGGSNDKDSGQELTLGKTHTTSVENSIADTVANTISQSISKTNEWSENFTNTEGHEISFDIGASLEKKDLFKIEASLGITNSNESSRGYGKGGKVDDDFGTSDTVSSSVSYTTGTSLTIETGYVIPGEMPKGTYSYVCVGKVWVYGIVCYDPVENKYYLDTYSVLDEKLREKVLYEAPSNSSANITYSEGLPFNAYASEQEMLDYLENVYYVSYDANGGSGEKMLSSVHKTGEKKNLLKNTYTREGHIFMGWGITPDGGVLYSDEAIIDNYISSGKAITLYAIWNPIPYTVSWNTGSGFSIKVERTSSPFANAGIGVLSSGSTVYYGDMLTVTYTNNVGYTITQKGDTSIEVFENITAARIYATAAANQYTIEYNANGGTGITVYSMHTYGQAKALTTNGFDRHGWTFQGWSTSPTGGVEYTDGQSVDNLSSDPNAKVTLYAVWAIKTKAIFTGNELYIKSVGEKGYAGDVASLLDVNALANLGYKCKITIKYDLQVDGDHLDAVTTLKMGGAEIFTTGDVRYDHNASGSPTHTINRSANEIRNNSGFEVWFDAKGITIFDAINRFWIRNFSITFEFSK